MLCFQRHTYFKRLTRLIFIVVKVITVVVYFTLTTPEHENFEYSLNLPYKGK